MSNKGGEVMGQAIKKNKVEYIDRVHGNSKGWITRSCIDENGYSQIVKQVRDTEFKKDLKEQLNLGLSFPKARSIAIEKYIKNSNIFNIDNIEHILNSPNNILAIEYCKSLFKLKSNINPITITRQGSGYNDDNLNQDNFSSASSIRKAITEKSLESCINVLPKYAYEILENSKISDVDRMFFYVKYKLLSNPQFLSNIPDANEGLWNKILNNIGNFNNFDEFIMSCKSKRYSYTRISRVLCQCFLSLSKEDILLSKSKPQYIRVLGLNKNGAKILKEIKKNSKIKIVNKISSKNTDPMLSIDIKATNLYSLLNNNIMHNADFKISPIILK